MQKQLFLNYRPRTLIRDDNAMADKEKPMVLTFNAIWVVIVFVFSLGVLHTKVTNGVEENAESIQNLKLETSKSIANLKSRVESDSKAIYLEIKALNRSQDESNKKGAELNNDVEW